MSAASIHSSTLDTNPSTLIDIKLPPTPTLIHIHMLLYIYVCKCVCVRVCVRERVSERERERKKKRERERERKREREREGGCGWVGGWVIVCVCACTCIACSSTGGLGSSDGLFELADKHLVFPAHYHHLHSIRQHTSAYVRKSTCIASTAGRPSEAAESS